MPYSTGRDPRGTELGWLQEPLPLASIPGASAFPAPIAFSGAGLWGLGPGKPSPGYEARGVTPGGAATPPHLDRAGPQKSRHQIRARGSLCTLPPSPYESTGPRSSPSKGSRGGDREVETACAQPCTCRGGRGGAGRLVPGGASFVLPSRRPRPGLAAGGGGRPRGAGAGPRLTCSPLGS